ncbi:DNA-binding protein [Myxococcota bacterium]|nr:DNA-binding protein [Myxococcota bacterium]MBU1381471.1 DNA-binding protein [Myxococcota bacterium]MBU1497695.1 DNA-binding protein [Myxococcota bacterium]
MSTIREPREVTAKKNQIERREIKAKRKGARPRTKLAKRLTKEEKKMSSFLAQWMEEEMPRTRAECCYGIRPCPYVRCRYNLYLEVKKNGAISGNHKCEPWEMEHSCALDVSEKGHHTLDQVGDFLNLTRERVRQIESDALEKLKDSDVSIEEYFALLSNASPQLYAYMDYLKYANHDSGE